MPTGAELRAMARAHSQTDPMPGSDWAETGTNRVVRIVSRPMDDETLAPMVVYYESGNPVYATTVEKFLADVTLPDGTVAKRFTLVGG